MLVAPAIVLCSSSGSAFGSGDLRSNVPGTQTSKAFEFATFSANEKQTPKSRAAQLDVELWGAKT
jgi:hypothetical protein